MRTGWLAQPHAPLIGTSPNLGPEALSPPVVMANSSVWSAGTEVEPATQIRGVGIKFGERIDANTSGFKVFVKRIVRGGPAHVHGGVSPGDVLLFVDHENVQGQGLDILRTKIPGPAGSLVNLAFRASNGMVYDVLLARTAYGNDEPAPQQAAYVPGISNALNYQDFLTSQGPLSPRAGVPQLIRPMEWPNKQRAQVQGLPPQPPPILQQPQMQAANDGLYGTPLQEQRSTQHAPLGLVSNQNHFANAWQQQQQSQNAPQYVRPMLQEPQPGQQQAQRQVAPSAQQIVSNPHFSGDENRARPNAMLCAAPVPFQVERPQEGAPQPKTSQPNHVLMVPWMVHGRVVMMPSNQQAAQPSNFLSPKLKSQPQVQMVKTEAQKKTPSPPLSGPRQNPPRRQAQNPGPPKMKKNGHSEGILGHDALISTSAFEDMGKKMHETVHLLICLSRSLGFRLSSVQKYC